MQCSSPVRSRTPVLHSRFLPFVACAALTPVAAVMLVAPVAHTRLAEGSVAMAAMLSSSNDVLDTLGVHQARGRLDCLSDDCRYLGQREPDPHVERCLPQGPGNARGRSEHWPASDRHRDLDGDQCDGPLGSVCFRCDDTRPGGQCVVLGRTARAVGG